jgi:hypothetical protein
MDFEGPIEVAEVKIAMARVFFLLSKKSPNLKYKQGTLVI